MHGGELKGDLGLDTLIVGQRNELATHLVLLHGTEVDDGDDIVNDTAEDNAEDTDIKSPEDAMYEKFM